MNTSDNNDIKSTPLGSESPEATENKETGNEVAEIADEEKSANQEADGEDTFTKADTEPNDPAFFDDDGYVLPSEAPDSPI